MSKRSNLVAQKKCCYFESCKKKVIGQCPIVISHPNSDSEDPRFNIRCPNMICQEHMYNNLGPYDTRFVICLACHEKHTKFMYCLGWFALLIWGFIFLLRSYIL
jgi:hypothetical protein